LIAVYAYSMRPEADFTSKNDKNTGKTCSSLRSRSPCKFDLFHIVDSFHELLV